MAFGAGTVAIFGGNAFGVESLDTHNFFSFFGVSNGMKKFLHTTLAATLLAISSLASAQTLLNVSYDVAREFYKDYNQAFVAHYKKTTGKDIKIDQAHGGSSAQARAVNDGLEADVVTMNTTLTLSSWPAQAWWPKIGRRSFPTTHRPPPRPCCSSHAMATPRASKIGMT